MSGVNAEDAAGYWGSDTSRKRAKHEAQQDSSDCSYPYDYYTNEQHIDTLQSEAPTKQQQQQPAKIKLSLKLGSLKRQAQPAQPARPPSSYHDTGADADNDDDGTADESVDIDDTEEYDEYRGSLSESPPPATAPRHLPANSSSRVAAAAASSAVESESHTPRIKLRLSFKKPASQAAAAQSNGTANTLGDPQHQTFTPSTPYRPSGNWPGAAHGGYQQHQAHAHTVSGSVVPTSPSESIASNDSSVYHRRVSSAASLPRSGRAVCSPSRASEVDSDDNRPATSYNDSDAEGQTFEHTTPFTPMGSSSDAKGMANGGSSVAKRRGRPPMRGRSSTSSISRKQSQTPTPRKPSGTFTTTVSLRSSLERLIKRIKKRDSYGFFLEPVDTSVITDYLTVITTPMDLGTMQRKVESGSYMSIEEFKQDLLLVCANARKYNGAGSIYAKSADRVQEYGALAIDRETVKLERVGMASISVRANGNDSDSHSVYDSPRARPYSRSRSRSRSRSATPTRDSAFDDHSDAATGALYSGDIGSEHRRSSRLRWRGTSDSHPHTPANVNATPSSIVDNFKWSGASKKKAKKHSQIPKKVTDTQMKVSVLADGSIDPAGFEDDMALVPYDRDSMSTPLVAGSRSAHSSSTAPGSTASYPIFAHGRYYSPATFKDFGPCKAVPRTPGGGSDKIASNLQSIHGDSVGLAYWSSISEFVDGAGDDVTVYAATVLDHLTGGAHAVARDTICLLSARDRKERPVLPKTVPPSSVLGDVNVLEIVSWLEHQPARDQLFAEKIDALTRPICLRDISLRLSRESEDASAAAESISGPQKQDLYEQNTRALRSLYELHQSGSTVAGTPNADQVEAGIYKLAEQLCLSQTGSRQPSTAVPGLLKAAAPPVRARAAAPGSPAPSPVGTKGGIGGANRSASATSLPAAIHSASLASAVRSDLMKDLAQGASSGFD